MKDRKDHVTIAQTAITGRPFSRSFGEIQGITIRQQRRSTIIQGWNLDTNEVVFENLNNCSVPTSDLPHISRMEAGEIDRTFVDGRDQQTILKGEGGTSHPYADIDKATRDRGGDPNHRIKKPDHSFSLGRHPSKMGRKKR